MKINRLIDSPYILRKELYQFFHEEDCQLAGKMNAIMWHHFFNSLPCLKLLPHCSFKTVFKRMADSIELVELDILARIYIRKMYLEPRRMLHTPNSRDFESLTLKQKIYLLSALGLQDQMMSYERDRNLLKLVINCKHILCE